MNKPSPVRIVALTMLIASFVTFATFTSPGIALQGFLTHLWANGLYHFLGQWGVPVVLYQNTVIGPRSTLEVQSNVNGLFLFAAVTCTAALWPLGAGRRAAWLLGGWVAVALVTFLRLLSSYLLSAQDPRTSLVVQRYVWPLLIVGLMAVAVRVLLRQPAPGQTPSPS
jgi:hypothetical protein